MHNNNSNQTFLPIPPAKRAIAVSQVIIKSQFSIMAEFSRNSQVESICGWHFRRYLVFGPVQVRRAHVDTEAVVGRRAILGNSPLTLRERH